jgi:hypothetical protein
MVKKIELNDYPKRMRVYYRKDGTNNEYIVFRTPYDAGISVLNPIGSMIFLLCDGLHSVQDILTEICKQYDTPSDMQVLRDIVTLLTYLSKCGVIVVLRDESV